MGLRKGAAYNCGLAQCGTVPGRGVGLCKSAILGYVGAYRETTQGETKAAGTPQHRLLHGILVT